MKDVLKTLLCLALGLVLGMGLVYLHCKQHGPLTAADGGAVVTHTVITDTITDTVPVAVAVPHDSVVVRYVTATLPVASPDTAVAGLHEDNLATASDSATVAIPITQTVYRRDSLYTAWVSGYRASLDSIAVYPRREVTVIKQPPKRFHLGVTVGYGITPHGPQPYLGAGLTYSIIGF